MKDDNGKAILHITYKGEAKMVSSAISNYECVRQVTTRVGLIIRGMDNGDEYVIIPTHLLKKIRLRIKKKGGIAIYSPSRVRAREKRDLNLPPGLMDMRRSSIDHYDNSGQS